MLFSIESGPRRTVLEKHPSLVLLTSGLYDLTGYVIIVAGEPEKFASCDKFHYLILAKPHSMNSGSTVLKKNVSC